MRGTMRTGSSDRTGLAGASISRSIALLGAAAALACATTSLPQQEFATVETPHFEILSSLDEDATRDLAEDLELFHTGVEFVLGLQTPEAPAGPRVRVLAFDDRSLTRPFLVDGAPSYLLPTPDGPVLVLRTGGGWDDATLELRHRYAHHVFRTRLPPRPLWYEEGLCQVASTLDVRDDDVRVGLPREDHVLALRDWTVRSLERTLGARDLAGWSDAERETFRAESWVLAHYLRFMPRRSAAMELPLGRFVRLLEAGRPQEEAAQEAFEDDAVALARKVNEHVRSRRFPWIAIRPQDLGSAASVRPRPVAREVSWQALGRLALALERGPLAAGYFRRAADRDPQDARAHSGLGAAAGLDRRFEDAEGHLARALALAPEDARVLLDAGATHAARAVQESEDRERWLARARGELQRSLALDPQSAEAHARLAATALIDGTDVEEGLVHAQRALRLQPASLELRLLAARLRAAHGETRRARAQALDVLSRAHAPDTAADARALLDVLGPAPDAGDPPEARPWGRQDSS